MKKLLIIALASLVSACACFDCEDEAPVTTYRADVKERMNCDYFDGKTCYRYVYRNVERQVARPVVYREQRPCYQAVRPVSVCPKTACSSCNPCPAQVRETREPVEVIYKKTTEKTVYEPKTYSQVSYERAPYSSVEQPEQAEVVDQERFVFEDIK